MNKKQKIKRRYKMAKNKEEQDEEEKPTSIRGDPSVDIQW